MNPHMLTHIHIYKGIPHPPIVFGRRCSWVVRLCVRLCGWVGEQQWWRRWRRFGRCGRMPMRHSVCQRRTGPLASCARTAAPNPPAPPGRSTCRHRPSSHGRGAPPRLPPNDVRTHTRRHIYAHTRTDTTNSERDPLALSPSRSLTHAGGRQYPPRPLRRTPASPKTAAARRYLSHPPTPLHLHVHSATDLYRHTDAVSLNSRRHCLSSPRPMAPPHVVGPLTMVT
jgi:hypothetical protein